MNIMMKLEMNGLMILSDEEKQELAEDAKDIERFLRGKGLCTDSLR